MTERRSGSFRPLFSEINPLFATSGDRPNIMCIRVRMRGEVDGAELRQAVETAMNRYPYFRVRLQKRGGEWGFTDNPLPVTVFHSDTGAALNSEESNHHLITFSWYEDWILMYMSHILTDGTGAYEALRTVLYCYCSRRYGEALSREGIRLEGDAIPPEEYDDPMLRVPEKPAEEPAGDSGGDPGEASALDPVAASGLQGDTEKTVFSVSVSEEEFMRLTRANNGSPAVMTALFLSRAAAGLHPDDPRPIRVSLCVNLRKALEAPLAHQSLVGGAELEYGEELKNIPLSLQAKAWRGRVAEQTAKEPKLEEAAAINRNTRHLMALDADEDRVLEAHRTSDWMRRQRTATVSYMGPARFGEAEKHILDFHQWVNALNENIMVEVGVMNGRFIFDFSQNFSNPVYWNAFLKQFEENGIACELYPVLPLKLPEIRLPWIR